MTLAEFEKLLDAFEGACYDVNVYGVPHTRRKPKRRQALLDAFAAKCAELAVKLEKVAK